MNEDRQGDVHYMTDTNIAGFIEVASAKLAQSGCQQTSG
jgi:hypothetical protein